MFPSWDGKANREFCTEIIYLEKKNLKYKPSFKIMSKLVRLGMGWQWPSL